MSSKTQSETIEQSAKALATILALPKLNPSVYPPGIGLNAYLGSDRPAVSLQTLAEFAKQHADLLSKLVDSHGIAVDLIIVLGDELRKLTKAVGDAKTTPEDRRRAYFEYAAVHPASSNRERCRQVGIHESQGRRWYHKAADEALNRL